MRPLLRRLAYRSGALALARWKQRASLTVVMLHRVMDPADPDFARADPVYTLSTPLFGQLLDFLEAHYAVVSHSDVMAAYDGIRPLPDHAVLITFDDGWADNLRYGAPILQQRGLPSVVFAVADAVRAPEVAWWQEQVFAAARDGRLSAWLARPDVNAVIGGVTGNVLDVVTRLGLLDVADRDRLLVTLEPAVCRRRMMLRPGELPALVGFGMTIALHGYSHLPLTEVLNVADELTRARDDLALMSDGKSDGSTLSCPHGKYDASTIATARAAGIKLIFTSDPWLNPTRNGMLLSDCLLGRINVEAAHIQDHRGRFDSSAAARWLWAREVWA